MSINFNYKIQLISKSKDLLQTTKKMSATIGIECFYASRMMDALEYLMDALINVILLDLEIGKDEALEFLDHISSDYEK